MLTALGLCAKSSSKRHGRVCMGAERSSDDVIRTHDPLSVPHAPYFPHHASSAIPMVTPSTVSQNSPLGHGWSG